ncbi:DHH phosphoesterase [Geobacillus phage GR1]|nr:DHH phosphoesterase [Geobacillus phage GR1]
MKIKQIGKYDGDIISTILKNRNIEDVDLFLNPNDKDDLDAMKLTNMKEGAEITLAHVVIENHIGILVDPDADGFSSATIIYQYLKKLNPEIKISYFLHDSKAHGLTEKILEQIADTSIDLLIIPDAASNDSLGIERIYHMGIDIVIVDHHEVEKEPQFGILINNQLSHNEETNKNLVGAGMAFKFCQAMDSFLKTTNTEDLYDLVAIGQIGDASDISENEVRNLVFKGLKNINNPFIKLVLEDCFGDIKNIAPKDLSFSIIPLINAVVRVGTMEEKELLFRALNGIGSDEVWVVEKRKKNKKTGKFDRITVNQNLYEYAYDTCKRVKNRQASLVKKINAEIEKTIDSTGGIAIGIVPNSDEGSITGLVANKLARKLQKPVILVHYIKNSEDKNGKYVGSGRGYEKVLPSLKDWCQETGLVEFAQGHANAFGISIFEENFEDFKQKVYEIKPSEVIYEVDLHVKGKVDKHPIIEVNENKHLFGGKVHDPLFAFTGIKVRKDFIRQRGSMLTFFENGVEFIMFSAPQGLFESLTHNFDQYITMDFVGTPSENNWGGRKTPIIILEDCQRNETGDIEEEVTAENIVF